MIYVTIDGDDVGQKITSSYLSNNVEKLISINNLVNNATIKISEILALSGFEIIFCAADGVAGRSANDTIDLVDIYGKIQSISCDNITFSMGSGRTLKDSFIALLTAKSNGKNQLCNLTADINNV